MKTTRNLVAILLVAFASLFAINAGGQVSSFPFPIGTPQIVESNAVSKVNRIIIWAWYYNNTNNDYMPLMTSVAYITTSLTNKAQMDTVIATELTKIVNTLISSTNQSIVKDKGIECGIACCTAANGNMAFPSFSTPENIFIMPITVDGKYQAPDLSSFSTTMSGDIPYYIPNMKRARLVVGLKGNPEPKWIYDGDLDPLKEILKSDGFMYLPQWAITDSSTASGQYWLKLSIITKTTFQIFDGDGNLLSKTPIIVKYVRSGNTLTVYVLGGDSGQGFRLQQSMDNKTWANGDQPLSFVSPLAHLSTNVVSGEYTFSMTNNVASYRVVLINGTPY